ncbi:hypothetical protein M2171_005581 [Bradyrhizobium japonicum USDA 38]|uniref:hypothetical protein n=1 Tax=Bradyrhizobium japonicum TaxID=375 RepID=UPI000489B2E3|nr:hypothetical protein [Bradyrhizobium japonicum]MCS3896448.1 hypothetical protein [Bradyrhizobium japonicum USDA 38]MCS3948963.1 hypothetical protein [Bradyrhizobium japonicum]
MAVTPKKRRPGGGRKATLHKVSTFSTRITAETRGALEAEATRSGLSISQLAEKLLDAGLKGRRYRSDVSSPVRALALVIENIDQESKSSSAEGRDCEWHNDPTIFETFRIAIGKMLEKLRPPGKIDASLDGPLIGRSPEEQAEAIFRRVWSGLLAAQPLTPRQVSELLEQRGWSRRSQEATAAWLDGMYSAVDVRETLGIKPERSQEK